MLVRHKALFALGATAAMLTLGSSAFAHSLRPVVKAAPLPRAYDNGTCKFVVTGFSVNSVSPSSTPGETAIDMAITVYEEKNTNPSGPWYFPDPSQVSNNPQALPEITVEDNNTNQTLASGLKPTSLVSNPDPSVTAGNSATAIYEYDVTLPNESDSYTVTLDQLNSGVFHMYQFLDGSVNTAPVCDSTPPADFVGQLPEAPFAAGLPLVGLGIVGAVWYRRKRVQPT